MFQSLQSTGLRPEPNSFARISAMRSPATLAALKALTEHSARNPDPRDPANGEHERRLQYAYLEAAMADGSYYAASIEESERWAAEAEAKALVYPTWAERYRKTASNHRWAADQAREKLAKIVDAQAERLAA